MNIILVIFALIVTVLWLQERQVRLKLSVEFKQKSVALDAVRTVVARSLERDTNEHIDPKIAPMVEEAKSLDLTTHQKRMHVMLRFMKEHPGSSASAVEEAIERALAR